MAFFGLTALGPQNSFEAASVHHRNMQIFEDQDFQEAWEKVNGKGAKYCKKEKMGLVLRALFHGPIPKTDVEPIENGFQKFDDYGDTITFDAYLKIMDYLRREAEQEQHSWEGKPNPECEFISSQDLQEALRKNSAAKKNLQMKQTIPITAIQEYGWEQKDLKPPVAGRSGSDITKFAAELIKNGIYY